MIVRIGSFVVSLVLVLTGTGIARAQSSISSAPPPTKGALYRDGQTDRYLLGGTWLYRADPDDEGVTRGWWNSPSSSVGWSPVESQMPTTAAISPSQA